MAVDAETEAFVASVLDRTLPTLGHEGHVRTAWYHSMRYSLPHVLEALPGVLFRFAAIKGHPEIYHETITYAFACVIHERATRAGDHTWAEFKASNPDLFERGFLSRYYDDDVLASAEARRIFVFPAAAGADA